MLSVEAGGYNDCARSRGADPSVVIASATRRGYVWRGSNICPREIEEEILTHPAAAEVAGVGVPVRMRGEVGTAVCIAREH